MCVVCARADALSTPRAAVSSTAWIWCSKVEAKGAGKMAQKRNERQAHKETTLLHAEHHAKHAHTASCTPCHAHRADKQKKDVKEKKEKKESTSGPERKEKAPAKKEEPVVVDDLLLPGADTAPPPAAPLGSGALPADLLPWVAEAWGLLRRFKGAVGLQEIPSLHQLEVGCCVLSRVCCGDIRLVVDLIKQRYGFIGPHVYMFFFTYPHLHAVTL